MSDQILNRMTSDLSEKISTFEPQYKVRDMGIVTEAGDGIAQVSGLRGVRSQEMVEFENDVMGVAFNLEKDKVGIIILGDYSTVSEGMSVKSTGRIVSVPVGDGLIGRVINALGQPIDGKGPIGIESYRPIERKAPGVMQRQDIDAPLYTGLKSIDAMIPIGKGQRELIVGDRQTGKTAIAVDTIINQKDKNVTCIYVAIGQKKSSVARMIATLERYGAMKYTIVVVASADSPAALQYISPYVGCAIGEEIMDSGRDALVIYDDLSKHAWAYRQISLLMRRPPGREAYPGDVFYLHSRLLERAARMANRYLIVPAKFESELAVLADSVNGKEYDGPIAQLNAEDDLKGMANPESYKIVKAKGSGGSLTALPIIETQLGDVSAYVPTNVISITDGQIYLETDLFNAGVRPAINVGISVSRVGGSAQSKAMKQVASRLRLDMASYRELAAFTQFGSDLDKSSKVQLERGKRLQELLKQPQYHPMPLEEQVVVLFAGTNGLLDQYSIDKIQTWERDFIKYLYSHAPEIYQSIAKLNLISNETEEKLREAITTFNSTWDVRKTN